MGASECIASGLFWCELVAPPAPAFSFVETPGSPPAEFGTGVADVAGLCRHRNHLSQSINHHQEPLVRGPVASRAPGPCVLLRRKAGESSRRIWYRCGRCCGFMSTSQSPITIYQSPSRASSSWPAGLVAPPAPAFSFVETPGSPPAQVWCRCG